MSYTYFEDIIFEFPVINSYMEAAILVFHLTPMTSHLAIARFENQDGDLHKNEGPGIQKSIFNKYTTHMYSN
jgi:hypothetical protein